MIIFVYKFLKFIDNKKENFLTLLFIIKMNKIFHYLKTTIPDIEFA